MLASSRLLFTVLNPLAVFIGIFGVLMTIPAGIAFATHDVTWIIFVQAVLVTLSVGAGLWLLTRSARRELKPRDAFLLVTLTWVILPLFGALPLYLYIPGITFTDAYFEATSGLTATGATVVSGLDLLPLSINFWRTFLHWIGGLGIIVLVVAILPMLGIGGRQLFRAESPTPIKDTSLTPRITETAKGMWIIYLLLTVCCWLALMWAGMSDWDALMHAFSIMGLGGFSSKDASLGYYNSLPIELVAMGFALIAGISFASYFSALYWRSLKPYRQDRELPYYLLILTISIAGMSVVLYLQGIYHDYFDSLRHVAFHTISLATSLGFATQDYLVWPIFSQFWILFLGSFIACSGSTGGGIKLMRAMILFKQLHREIVRSIHPASVVPVRIGSSLIPPHILHAVLGFFFVYIACVIMLSMVLMASGLDPVTAFSAVVACLNNTGPGLGLVGPTSNYAVLNDLQTWVCTFAMLLGRLEIFTLLVVLTPAFWRK